MAGLMSPVAAWPTTACFSGRKAHLCVSAVHGPSTSSRCSMRRAGTLQPLQHATATASGRGMRRVVARAEPEQERQVVYNTEFGYSRKDVLIIIVALIALGVFMYEGLQAAGMSAGMAGNWVQLTIFMGICVGWVSTYLWRVANKKMTYAQQLQMYEEAVMQKRLEEMTEAELEQLMTEVETDKQKFMAAKAALQKQQQSSSSSSSSS